MPEGLYFPIGFKSPSPEEMKFLALDGRIRALEKQVGILQERLEPWLTQTDNKLEQTKKEAREAINALVGIKEAVSIANAALNDLNVTAEW